MGRKKKEVVVEKAEKRPVEPTKVTFHKDRWDHTSNQLVSDKLPSLND